MRLDILHCIVVQVIKDINTKLMKKNYRKVPDFIWQKLDTINQQEIIVCTVFKVTSNEINNPKYRNLGLTLINRELHITGEYIPNRTTGVYCRRNLDGYRITHRDQPKVSKEYYMGERPVFGDYNRGTFSLFQTRLVFPYDEISPKELSICTEIIDERQEGESTIYTLKVKVNQILLKNDPNFNAELFFALNLLQENVYSVNVFAADTDIETYRRTLEVSWEIFPPGEREDIIQAVLNTFRIATPQIIQNTLERQDFLQSLEPVEYVLGVSGMRRYFGAKFSDQLVVFENVHYGNAIYILFNDWEELSKRSRLDLLLRPNDQYVRIPHRGDWQEKTRQIVNARR